MGHAIAKPGVEEKVRKMLPVDLWDKCLSLIEDEATCHGSLAGYRERDIEGYSNELLRRLEVLAVLEADDGEAIIVSDPPDIGKSARIIERRFIKHWLNRMASNGGDM